MKRLLILLFLSAPLHAFAQETVDSSTLRRPAPERRLDLSTFGSFGGPMSGYGGSTTSGGLMLRRASRCDPQVWRRFGLGLGSATRDGRERAIPVSADTALLVRSFIDERMLYGVAGAEIERHFRKKVFVAVGIDVQAGYAWGSRDSAVLVMSPTTAYSGVAEYGYVGQGRDVWSAFGTGLLFAGFRTYDKRFTIAVDAFTGIYAAYREEAGSSLFDMNNGKIGVRLSAGYRF